MGAGGHISAMLSSLKNNARKRRTIYDQDDVYNKKGKRKRIIQTKKNASPEELKELQQKLKKEKSKRISKTIVIGLVLILVATISLILFQQL